MAMLLRRHARLRTGGMIMRMMIQQDRRPRQIRLLSNSPSSNTKELEKIEAEMRAKYKDEIELISTAEERERDPDQIGDYPNNVPLVKAIDKNPYAEYWDSTGRRNFGDTV